jgi:hypothetical protein
MRLEGLRKYRFFDIAILDVATTIFVVYIIHLLLLFFRYKHNFWILLLFVFILGIFVHRIFDVRTGIDKMLFKNV